MPQDSGADREETAKIATAARRVLEETESEPIPEPLIKLARQLEAAIARKLDDAAHKQS